VDRAAAFAAAPPETDATMKLNPYLTFEGRCEEAIHFYQQALGAKVTMLMRMKDNPEPASAMDGCNAGAHPEKILHAELDVQGQAILCSDGMMNAAPEFKGFGLALEFADEATVRRHIDALADGGQVFMPPGRTFWSPCFGMVADRFGVMWMVGAAPQ
jgi:PhnB protein